MLERSVCVCGGGGWGGRDKWMEGVDRDTKR